MNASPSRTVALVADTYCKEHDSGVGHPEAPGRFDAVMNGLADAEMLPKLLRIEPKRPTPDDLHRAHAPGYLAVAEKEITAGQSQLSTGDTNVGPHSWEAALRAAGSGIAAVDAVISGKAAHAFCVVRPPGHHATPDKGMGFCVLNNIAIAARYAQAVHGLGKVVIVDWDVHHGNGTQDIFYTDPSVFFFSTHQSPWYPGTGAADETGEGKGKGTTLNCPLPAGSGRAAVLGAFEQKLAPALAKFRPEMVLISAGFDSRIHDPLGQFTLEDQDFADLTRLMLKIAGEHSGGRVVSMLEGGYNLQGLASASAAHVSALVG
jgi:acetoin utilization deacetylase AcuC-like enzyme